MSQPFRYPGPKPFKIEESEVFYGRSEEVQELYQLVELEPLVVLFAKSGLGKSSLINAGLIPSIQAAKSFHPINIRFYAHTENQEETPLAITRKLVQRPSALLDKIKPEGKESLWYHLKSQQLALGKDRGILLVFDQFEELFSYGEAAVQEFAEQLSEALYTTLPQSYRNKRRAGFETQNDFLQPEELELLDSKLNLHVLLAIRSDRMSLLKRLKAYLPAILAADFELQPLSRIQAEDAILGPAYQKLDFATPVFDYEDDAIEYLLDFLSKDKKQAIESFELQILCEYVERHLVEKEGKKKIAKTDIINPDRILENYYLDKIASIGEEKDRLAARRLIEEGLIFEEEERRLTLYEGQIFKSFGVNANLIRQLLDTHLIRSEPSLRGGYSYELSHDTLVAPVLKAKAKRKEEELEKLEEAKRLEQKRLLAEERQKRRRVTVLAIIGFLLAAVSIVSSFFAFTQSQKAQESQRKAQENERKAQEALDNFLEQKNAREQIEIQQLLQDAETYSKALEYELALQTLAKAKAIDSTNVVVLEREIIYRDLQNQ